MRSGALLATLVLVAAALVAYVVLRDRGDSESEPATAPTTSVSTAPAETETATQTETVAETETETETETEIETETETETATTAEGGFQRLIGLGYARAVRLLLADGLLPDTYPVESTHIRGLVVSQRPAVGADVPRGAGVRLNVSIGERTGLQLTVPDLTGLLLPEALRRCAAAGFTCRTVNERGRQRVVARQRPEAGRSIGELGQIALITSTP